MYELRIRTHTGKTLSFVSPQMKSLRLALRNFSDTLGLEGYAFRDATGWSESGGKEVDTTTELKAIVVWSTNHQPIF